MDSIYSWCFFGTKEYLLIWISCQLQVGFFFPAVRNCQNWDLIFKAAIVVVCDSSYLNLSNFMRYDTSSDPDMATHSIFLPGESHGRRSLVGYSPWGRKESDTTERLHFTPLHFIKFCHYPFLSLQDQYQSQNISLPFRICFIPI